MSDKEKRVTAYHEAGHALTAWAMPNLDPVHKVTILPRGRSLGHTLVLPLEDRYTQTRVRDPRPARLRPRRAGRRGARLPRADHRRVQRHREGHRAGPRDGHRVRHEREARRGQVRHRRRRAVHGPRLRPPARLLRGHRRRHRRRGARPHRGRARRGVGDPGPVPRRRSTRMVLELVEKETLDQGRPRADPGAGPQAPAAQHVHRLRQAHAQRPPADRDPAVAAQAAPTASPTGTANGNATAPSAERRRTPGPPVAQHAGRIRTAGHRADTGRTPTRRSGHPAGHAASATG